MKRHLTEITIQRMRPPAKGKGYLEIFDLGYPGLAIRVGNGGAKTFEHFHRASGKLKRETLVAGRQKTGPGARQVAADS